MLSKKECAIQSLESTYVCESFRLLRRAEGIYFAGMRDRLKFVKISEMIIINKGEIIVNGSVHNPYRFRVFKKDGKLYFIHDSKIKKYANDKFKYVLYGDELISFIGQV